MNICLINTDAFHIAMPARSEVMEVYGKYMPSFGHKMTWIVPSNGEKSIEVQGDLFKNVCIYTIPLIIGTSFISKTFNFAIYQYKKYIFLNNLCKKERYDIIQVRDDVFGALLALHIKRKYKIPFIFQYSFPKGLYKIRKRKNYSYFFGILESSITKYILRRADMIFPISKWMKEELARENIPKSRMMPLPMSANPEIFSQRNSEINVKEKYSLDGQIILYLGEMSKQRQLCTMIRAFSEARAHKNNIKLLMVGDGNGRKDLEELVLTLGMKDDVIFTGQVPFSEVPHYIASAYTCISFVPPLDIYKVSSPTKMFEYMSMGKPVLANEEIPEQKEVIVDSGGGILVKFNEKSLSDGIVEILNNPEKANRMGKKGREWIVKNRSYENMARKVEKIYLKLMDSGGVSPQTGT
jgi:glycosyltransferase involved in cell wall biosynthesis